MIKNLFLVCLLWSIVVGIALSWNIYDQRTEKNTLAFQVAQAFFDQVVITRSWNSSHGGVYVPVTEHSQPNRYLNDPLRELSTVQSITLTKINPAYMTRQISEMTSRSDAGIKFHITSLNPIRPENKASDWEKVWLQSFEAGEKEQGAFLTEGSNSFFRYMAPLSVEDNCLKCHAEQGYKKGDIRGGISVTLPHFSQDLSIPLVINYGIAGLLGISFIIVGGRKLDKQRIALQQTNKSLEKEIAERQKALDLWKKEADEVQQLKGIVPICMHCKEIRDDDGFWNRLENYIESHSNAQFSHSICDKCIEKFYPELNDV